MAAKAGGKQRQRKEQRADDFFVPRSRSREELQHLEGGVVSSVSAESRPSDAVLESLERLHSKFDTLENKLTGMEKKMAEQDARLTASTHELTGLSGKLQLTEQKLGSLETKQEHFSEFQTCAATTMVEMGRQVEILSNAYRAANIRVLGFPVISENLELRSVIEIFFKTVVLGDAAESRGDVKRAFRLSTRGPTASVSNGGTILAVLRVAEDRDVLLRAAARKEGVLYQDSRVLLFPDYCKETAMRRSALQRIRVILIQKGAAATVVNPAKLRVTFKEKLYFFTEVAAAERFAESLPGGT